MKVAVAPTAGGVVALVGVAVVGYIAWKAYKTGADFAAAAKAAAAKVGAQIAYVSNAVSLDTVATDADYSNPEAQAQGAAALGEAGGSNAAYYIVNQAGGAMVADPAGNGKNADGTWSLGGYLSDTFSGNNDKIRAMLGPQPQAQPRVTAQSAQQADIARVQAAYEGT